MAGRRLSADERALWRRVTENVRALAEGAGSPAVAEAPAEPRDPAVMPAIAAVARRVDQARRSAPGTTLDGGWDRRLERGLVAPDVSLDLHGHTLDSAYRALDLGLERAVAARARVVLLITGRAPRGEGAARRGVIRAAIGDWLGASRHAARIAAIRNAHPRHGGAGALYVILRRQN